MVTIDQAQITGALEFHRTRPEISVDGHVKSRSLQLGASLQGRKKLYLDKRFWLIFRDAELGRRVDPGVPGLLEKLRTAVKTGACICPISETIFLELLKQQDAHTRYETARLIDELSEGVTLVPTEQRIAQEFVGLLSAHAESADVHSVSELVWSKLTYVLGVVHPTSTELSEADELAVQKAFFDFMWDLSLVDVIGHVSKLPPPSDRFDALAERVNKLNDDHSGEVRSFKQVYLDEFRGGLSLFIHVPRQYFQDLYERRTGRRSTVSDDEDQAHEAQLYTFFGNLVRKKQVALMLPTLHIGALCHAAVRWDKGRNLKPNDFYDFRHASAAVEYCDAFLTEKPLRSLLQQRHVGVEADFPCRVMSAVDEARQWMVENVSG